MSEAPKNPKTGEPLETAPLTLESLYTRLTDLERHQTEMDGYLMRLIDSVEELDMISFMVLLLNRRKNFPKKLSDAIVTEVNQLRSDGRTILGLYHEKKVNEEALKRKIEAEEIAKNGTTAVEGEVVEKDGNTSS